MPARPPGRQGARPLQSAAPAARRRIVKAAARINNSKAAGPVGARLRDAMLPWILNPTAGGKAHRETYGYRIEESEAA
jgi:FAD-dependent urate hydroxylase